MLADREHEPVASPSASRPPTGVYVQVLTLRTWPVCLTCSCASAVTAGGTDPFTGSMPATCTQDDSCIEHKFQHSVMAGVLNVFPREGRVALTHRIRCESVAETRRVEVEEVSSRTLQQLRAALAWSCSSLRSVKCCSAALEGTACQASGNGVA